MKEIDLKDLQVPDIPRQTIHLEWNDLRDISNELLHRLLKRKIPVDVERSDYYDWGFTLVHGASLSPKELKKLFSVIKADDWDKESNDFGEDQIQSLSQSLSRKLVSLLLPYPADASLADDEGVWFIGGTSAPQAGVKPDFPDEMPKDETLFTLICDGVDYEQKAYEDEMYRKGIKELLSHIYDTSIIHEVTALIIDEVNSYFDLEEDRDVLTIMYGLARSGNFLDKILRWSLDMDSVDISNYGMTEQLIRDFCTDYAKTKSTRSDLMKKKYVHHKAGDLITENSDNIAITGHFGTWYVVDIETHNDRILFELEHETHGDTAAHLIVDCHGTIVLDEVWNGFADYYESLE